jgi:phospholipid/cholesterol/gamma-HCH transport system substrate-binding protein
MKITNEAKVGGLIVFTFLLSFIFARVIGVTNPFHQSISLYVTYNFAGGIEVGSPVRVAGIKVGKVEKIEFFSPIDYKLIASGDQKLIALKEPGSEITDDGKVITPLKIKISVRKDAATGIRKDSRFYINLAGIIGERYVEITPGHLQSPQVLEGDIVAGVDPPRMDQLLSQSFDLAGKLKDIIDENKGDITRSLELLAKLSGNLNKTLGWVDKSAIFKTDLSKLVGNLISITTDVRRLTDRVSTADGEKTLNLLYDLLWRLEPLDSKTVRGFLQKEGVKVQFF